MGSYKVLDTPTLPSINDKNIIKIKDFINFSNNKKF